MAVLSPPASRYAFEPSATTAAIPPLGSVHPVDGSPLLEPVHSTSFGSSGYFIDRPNSSIGYGNENDVPAFEPQTELVLQGFTQDLKTFTNWVKHLNPEEQKTCMDVFLAEIKDEVWQYVKSKVNDTTTRTQNEHGILFSPPLSSNNLYQAPVRPVSPLLALNSESATLDSILSDDQASDPVAQPKPMHQLPSQMRTGNSLSHVIGSDPVMRPRSAGAMHSDLSLTPLNGQFQRASQLGAQTKQHQSQSTAPLLRVFSPDVDPSGFQRRTKEFMEPTGSGQFGLTSADLGGSNAIKLSNSLNTITHRSKIDPSRSKQTNSSAPTWSSVVASSDDRGRGAVRRASQNQSSSLPPAPRGSSKLETPAKNSIHSPQPKAAAKSPSHAPVPPKSPVPRDIASKSLLADIPAWLKTLRLHKYTDNLQHLKWPEMIELNDAQLAELGVSTVGARNKLLKSFAFVKENLHD
ncbi:hypothetical protein KL929_000988 [Ogataea haglerorum]|uniref:SAM domain-containing protein n=1 Tax=Ogataea haglerorum TaxID=1937702 RepID=A0ABQ7RP93_9ASCO|nr:uncharacterized protein KL911_003387 [Ogataea haglerorum]KAG7711488.1 hypothetical protein KL914_000130 [Ogataea haglerorum]KAG7712259.1 hypothetical protein KL950_000130 [Ogataea haglerorum]KAG7722312.1 hypothetical protein KL913_000132 [Ogataea haglerorum]KAG7723584.1 hypothetical protein KL949_000634 [Ogataea haglerorum]KAG7734565.1 hypothetical protein KL948_000131 [Ogataea haglerorum]